MKPYLRVTLAYALFGVIWIFFSDKLVALLANDFAGLTYFQTMKGWLFVSLSSLLILTITRRAFERHERTEKEKLAVFQKTVGGSYHIFLNYLNQMQLVTIEAEQCAGFDKEVLKLATTASDDAAAALEKLSRVETITVENIDAVVFENIRNGNGGA
jgi:hypothetical protein